MLERAWPATLLALAVAMLAACGGDDDDQTHDGGAGDGGDGDADADADVDAGDDGGAHSTLQWSACGNQMQCATLDVPVDHDDPGGAALTLSLTRLPSVVPAQRIGSLLFNPGGPGGSAVQNAMALFPSIGQLAPDFAAQFDFVAFDPRGVGASAPIECADDDAMNALLTMDLSPDDDEEWAVVDAWVQAFTSGCVAGAPDTVAWVDTANTARDMDLVRAALGEERLNYLGVSYGTVLGALYATLFPDRIRAFVLDSPVPPATDIVEYQHRQVTAYEVELGRFFADCGDDASCTFHGGEGRAVLETAYDTMLAALDATPIPAGAESLTQGGFQAGVASDLRLGDWTALAAGLRDAEAGDGTALLGAAGAFFGRQPDGSWTNFLEALVPILLLDVPCPAGYDLAAAQADAATFAAEAPRVGMALAGIVSYCAYWSVERPTPRVAIDAAAAPPMFVLAGLHDPATAYAGAAPFLDALGNDSYLLTWEGNGHGVSNRNLCTLGATIGFFADPTTAPATTRCTP